MAKVHHKNERGYSLCSDVLPGDTFTLPGEPTNCHKCVEAKRPLNLEAIEGADHMNITPEGHDPDGWFRQTIRQLIAENRKLRAEVSA